MNRLKKARSLVFQIIILLILFSIAFLLLARANLIQLPGFIQNLINKETEITTETTGNNRDIFEYINNTPDNSSELGNYPTITVDNMNKLLNSLSPHSNFYWESISETYFDDEVITKNCRSRISGDRYNVEILDKDGNITRKYISDGTKTSITRYNGHNIDTSSYSTGIFDFYSDTGLISIDYFKDTDFSAGACEIRLVENQQYNLVSVVYTYERNGVTVKNDYGISLDYGVVLFAQCFENDIPVFKQTTALIYPLKSLDDKMFSVN